MKHQMTTLPDELGTFSFIIRTAQSYAAVDSEKLLKLIGAEMGHAVAKKLTASDPDELLYQIRRLSDELCIGEMSVTSQKPLQVTFHGCLGCDQIPGPGQDVYCPFREAVLKTIIDDRLKIDSTVNFLGSEGSEWGTHHCLFEIKLGTPAT